MIEMELAADPSPATKRILQLPVIRELHARRLLFPAILGLTILGVLVHGALERGERVPSIPRPQIDLALPTITVPSIRPSLEKSPLTYQSDYWLQLAELTRNKIVPIGPRQRPGIMVAPGVAVTSISAADEVEAEFHPLPDSGDAISVSEAQELVTPLYRVLGVDTELGIALFAVKQPDDVENFTDPGPVVLKPASYVVAISRKPDGGQQIVPGYVTSAPTAADEAGQAIEFTVPFPKSSGTAAIVNLDGELVGIAAPSDDGFNVVLADRIPPLIQRLTSGAHCLAIGVGEIDEPVRDLLKISRGVIVEQVREDAFLPEPSVHEGDILLDWNAKQIESAERFEMLYREAEPGTLVNFRLIRDGRAMRGRTRMPGSDCRPVQALVRSYARLGITVGWEDGGWKAVRVVPISAAAGAGIRAGDVIIGVGGQSLEPRDASPFEQYESRPESMVFTVRREGRVSMVAITPLEEEPATQP